MKLKCFILSVIFFLSTNVFLLSQDKSGKLNVDCEYDESNIYMVNINDVINFILKSTDSDKELDKLKVAELVSKVVIADDSALNKAELLIKTYAYLAGSTMKKTPQEFNLPVGEYVVWIVNNQYLQTQRITIYQYDSKYITFIDPYKDTVKSYAGVLNKYNNNLSEKMGRLKIDCDSKAPIYLLNWDVLLSFVKKNTDLYKLKTHIQNTILKKSLNTKEERDFTDKLYLETSTNKTTPYEVEVPVGNYFVWVIDQKNVTRLQEIYVGENGVKEVFFKQKKMLLEVDSNVKGATVLVDGYNVGKTPLSTYIDCDLKSSFGITLSKDGYKSESSTVFDMNKEKHKEYFKLKRDLNFSYEEEHANFGFITMFLNNPNYKDFFNIYGVAKGLSYHVNFGYAKYAKCYFSTDHLFATPYNKPSYIKEAFLYLNTYSIGFMITIPVWRFHIQFGGAPKIGYMIEYVKNDLDKEFTGAYFGFGTEGVVGLKFLVTDIFGFFIYYKCGLLQDVFSLINDKKFNNLDGHCISVGIRF